MVLVTLVDFDTIFKATMVFWRESCKYHEFLHGGAGDSRSLNSLSVIWPLRRCFSFWHVISLGSFDVLLWLSAVWRQQEQKTCPHDTVTLLFVVEKRAGVRVKFVSWFSPKDVLTCLVWTFCVGLSGALRESAYSKLYLCNFTLSSTLVTFFSFLVPSPFWKGINLTSTNELIACVAPHPAPPLSELDAWRAFARMMSNPPPCSVIIIPH